MFATTILTPGQSRFSRSMTGALHNLLALVGMMFLLLLAQKAFARYSPHEPVQAPTAYVQENPPEQGDAAAAAPAEATPAESAPALNQGMRRALGFVARRYSVSDEALTPIFAAAQRSGEELGIDPLLIIAVIGIESRFNPFSQSVVGAQGLMQVMPSYHASKVPEGAGELPFFDPVINVQVGARVLKESISRNGGVVEGLQQFAGALGDPDRRYSAKVLSEHQRLQAAARSARKA